MTAKPIVRRSLSAPFYHSNPQDQNRQQTMKTIRHLLLTLAASLASVLPARAEYAVFDSPTDSIALANGTTMGTTATYEVVFSPTSTTSGNFYFEQIDAQEHKAMAASAVHVSGIGFVNGVITTGLSASTSVAPRVFHHLAFVRDGAQERIYLDGTMVGSRAVTNVDIGDAANTAFAAAIGAGRYSTGTLVDPSFIGALDSIRISSTARYSGATITAPTGDMTSDGDTLLLMNFDLADVTGNVVADLSGNGRNGTLGTTFPGATKPTIVATAPLNQRPTAGDVSAVPFSMATNGVDQQATVPHHAVFDALESGNEVTFEGWMRVQAFPAGGNPFALFDKHEATPAHPNDYGWILDARTTSAGMTFTARQSSELFSNSTTGQIAVQEWTHVAVTLNQATLEAVMYKNGEEIRRAVLPAGLTDTSGEALFFGFSPSGGDEFLNGNFSEVRMWNRVLPEAEIKQRMFTQATGKENGLVTAWSMDEGAGTTLGNRVAGAPVGTFGAGGTAPTWSTNVPPVLRQRQTAMTTMDTAVVITLRGTDYDGDALVGKITSLPTSGSLFQFDNTPIAAAGTVVTDPQNRVVYVPGSGFTGAATLSFSMSDGVLESADALLTVQVSAAPVTTRTTWSAGDDFYAIEKPDGVNDRVNPNVLVPEWSYGTRLTASGTLFTPLTLAQHGDSLAHADLEGYAFDGSGGLTVNTGTSPVILNFGSGPLLALQPREITHSPGGYPSGAGLLPVTRWTAPYAGTFAVDATWRHLDPNGGDGVSANLVVNGTSVFAKDIFRTSTTTFQVLTLNAGDIVDFVLGKVSGVTFDGTGFTAHITAVRNVYDAGKVISRWTGNPNGVWRYGTKTATDAAALTLFQQSNRFGDSTAWQFWPSSTNFGFPVVFGYGQSDFFMGPSSNTSPGLTTVRFTAPKTARYRVFGFFSLGDIGNVDVHLRRGSDAIFDSVISGTNSKVNFDRTVDLSVGQTLDMVMGPNGSQNNDNTGERFFVMELPEPQPSTIVHYRFEEGPAAGAVGAMLDSGPYQLHGTASGTLTHSTSVAANPEAGAFSLDARGDSNYGTVPDNGMLHLQGDWTVETFFKADAPYDNFGTSDAVGYTLVAKQNAQSGSFLAGYMLALNSGNGRVTGEISFGSGTGASLTGLSNTMDGGWHHAALVLKRDVSGATDELRLYVDGVLEASTQAVMPDLFYGTDPLNIGAGNFGGAAAAFRRNFDGHIDEVRISSAALAPSQMLVNLAPTAITLNGDKVRENEASGTVVGTLAGTDPTPGDALVFTLVSGAGDGGNGSFAIVGNELRTTAAFDYTTQASYPIRIRATDGGGKFFEQTFTVTVLDAPVLTLPASPVIAEATSAAGAVVNFTAIATDVEDNPDPVATAVPPSGSIFPLGDTTVNVSATDLDGATTNGSLIVRVQDTTGPTITITGSNPALVVLGGTYTDAGATALDLVSGDVSASIVPSSNVNTAVLGSYTVSYDAVDAAGNHSTAARTVNVVEGPGALAFATATQSSRPVNQSAQPNIVQVPITRTGGAGGAVSVTAVPSQPATVPSGFAKYVYGVDYEFVNGTSAGTTVNFADGQTSATVALQLKTPVLTKRGQFKLTLSAPAGGATLGTITVCTVTIEGRDAIKPVITISPALPSTVPATFTVAGTVTEAGGGLSSFKIELNGVEQTLAVDPVGAGVGVVFGAAFSATGIAPENGSNFLSIVATDLSGNTATVTKTVGYANNRPALAGTYNAVLEATGAPDFDTTGLVSVTVTNTGIFSGKVTLSDVTVPFTGVIANNGVARFFRTGFASFTAPPVFDLLSNIGNDAEEHESYLGAISFTIDETNGITGTLQTTQTGGSVLANFDGKKAPFSSLNPVPAALVGLYTVVFPSKEQTPAVDHTTYPQGDGWATLTVSSAGIAKFSGKLADGTAFSSSVPLRADNSVVFFRQLYRKRGAIAGDIALADLPDSDLTGPGLVWLRPELRRARYYPSGWPDGIRVDAVGTKFTSLASLNFGQGAIDLVNGNVSFVFTDGNLASTLIHPVNISPTTGAVVRATASGTAHTLSFSPGTGAFTGTFPHTNGKNRLFNGILLNKGANKGGFGFFLDEPPLVFGATGQSGGVSLEP